jgi:cytochrome c oxidase subunit 2
VLAGRRNEAYKNRIFSSQWLKLNSGILVEIIWTIIPSFILLLIAIPSFALLFAIDEITVSKVVVKVIGHQWYWSYEVSGLTDVAFRTAVFDSYMLSDSDLEKGDLRLLKTDNALILPKNMPVLVLITSDDVLHSWAVPSFGVKVDAVPGRLSQISLLLKNSGSFSGQCSELCGVNHGFMPIEI